MNGWGGPDGSHPDAAECQYRVWMGLACMHACRGSGGGGVRYASMNGTFAATVHKVVGTGMSRLERCLQERPRGAHGAATEPLCRMTGRDWLPR